VTSTYAARSGTSTYRASSQTPTDAALLDWLRHYGIVLLLVTVIGSAGAGATWWLATPRYEMWTTVADTGSSLPDRQVGVVGQTLFQSKDTLTAASTDLTSKGEPASQNQVLDATELRSVPDSRLMIVVARGDDLGRTTAMSESMANALSAQWEKTEKAPLSILGDPRRAPVETSGSLSLFVILGAISAFLLALGFSIAHYRFRRPVLEFGAMMTLLAPTTVIAVSARRRWLGALRHITPVGLSDAARKDVARRLGAGSIVGSMHWPGASRRRQVRLRKLVGIGLDPAATKILLVTEPCSRSRDLSEAALVDPVGTTTVLWLT
jgi:hypothetical protein